MHPKCVFDHGFTPDSTGRATALNPKLLAVFEGATLPQGRKGR